MKNEVIITYDEADKKLLDISMLLSSPNNPCKTCDKAECHGCMSKDWYDSWWEIYKNAGIEDIAKKLLRREEIKQEISKLKDEFDLLTSQIPSQFIPD